MDKDILEAEEKMAKRRAVAFLRPALFDKIASLKGKTLGNWMVISIYGIGGKGVLLRVCNKGENALMKLPMLPYDKPVSFGMQEIFQAREELAWEAKILEEFSPSLFPRYVALPQCTNPLLQERPDAIAGTEKFLVLEYIPGIELDIAIQNRLHSLELQLVQAWLLDCISSLLQFLSVLKHKEPGYFYTDFKPSHLRITPKGDIRLLDAGSITTLEKSAKYLPISLSYCPSCFRQSLKSNSDLELISLISLGRTFYASLLNKVLYEDAILDFGMLQTVCGIPLTQWFQRLNNGEFSSIEEARAFLPTLE